MTDKLIEEFDQRMKEIAYDLTTLNKENRELGVVFDKMAEANLELFDLLVRTVCEDQEMLMKRLVVMKLSDPIVKGINDRLKHTDLYYAQESDDLIDTIE